MACSPAQLASNRRNSLLSTGPKTPEGKARSRANGLKHGLTGAGVVLASGDAAEVARTFEALEIEMAPNNELARKLVNRVALMTVKLDRCSEHEAKAISYRTRRAVAEFDDARLAEVEAAYSWIAKEPATNARRLRGSPEGIDRLVEGLESLRSELTRPDDARWSWQCCEHLHHLMGRRRGDVPVTRARALGDAVGGNFQHLEKDDGADLAKLDRQGWAAGHLIALIDAEVSRLKALREGLDLEGLELDRAEAPARALFDASPAAVLARKYEAAVERGLYRAIREFREVQAEGPLVGSEAGPGRELEAEPAEGLASSFPGPSGDDHEAEDVDAMTPEIDLPPPNGDGAGPSGRALDDRPTSNGRDRAVFPGQTPHPVPPDGGPGRR